MTFDAKGNPIIDPNSTSDKVTYVVSAIAEKIIMMIICIVLLFVCCGGCAVCVCA